jgi:two-component system chemotaxis response regulator CheB
VAQAGGTVLVQDPEDALAPGMPSATLQTTEPDAVLPLRDLPRAVLELAARPALASEVPMSSVPDPHETLRGPTRPDGSPSGFTCPECSGPLWELREGNLVRYRCRVGHLFSEEAMVDAQGSAVEAALWTALEVLEERFELLGRIADRSTTHPRTRERFQASAREAADRAAIIRRVLAATHETAA